MLPILKENRARQGQWTLASLAALNSGFALLLIYLLFSAVGEVYANNSELHHRALTQLIIPAIPLPWLALSLFLFIYQWRRTTPNNMMIRQIIANRTIWLLRIEALVVIIATNVVCAIEDIGPAIVMYGSLIIAAACLMLASLVRWLATPFTETAS